MCKEGLDEVQNGLVGFVDDLSGAKLDPSLVRKAKQEEIDYYYKMNVFDKVPLQECYDTTGAAPLKGRWIDHNK